MNMIIESLNMNRQQIINLFFNKLGMSITNIDENIEFIIKSKFDIYTKLKNQYRNQIIESINDMLIIEEYKQIMNNEYFIIFMNNLFSF